MPHPRRRAARRARQIRPATLAELEAIAEAMPGRYRLMVLLAAWCGAAVRRAGRAAPRRHRRDELRDPRPPRRRPGGGGRGEGPQVRGRAARRGHPAAPDARRGGPPARPRRGQPGCAAVPSRVAAATWPRQRCTASTTRPGRRPGGRTCGSTTCGTPGPTLAAATGATLAELMARLGHSTPAAAHALPARRGRPRQGDRRRPVRPRHGHADKGRRRASRRASAGQA